jgi:cytochrome P450
MWSCRTTRNRFVVPPPSTQTMHPLIMMTVTSVRYARKEFTFSDGMVIPAGSTIASPIKLLHDSDLADPDVFDGFRYSQMNEDTTGPSKYQMVNTDYNYVLFGHGKHAW